MPLSTSPDMPYLQNPNLSLPLFLLGLFLLYLDFNLPGKVLPAALGMFLLCLSVFGLLHTPLVPWALALTLAAVALILLDLPFPTRNVLPAVATALLAYSLFHLAAVPNAPHRVHPLTALLSATAFTGITLKLGRIALLARRNKQSGPKHVNAR